MKGKPCPLLFECGGWIIDLGQEGRFKYYVLILCLTEDPINKGHGVFLLIKLVQAMDRDPSAGMLNKQVI